MTVRPSKSCGVKREQSIPKNLGRLQWRRFTRNLSAVLLSDALSGRSWTTAAEEASQHQTRCGERRVLIFGSLLLDALSLRNCVDLLLILSLFILLT